MVQMLASLLLYVYDYYPNNLSDVEHEKLTIKENINMQSKSKIKKSEKSKTLDVVFFTL